MSDHTQPPQSPEPTPGRPQIPAGYGVPTSDEGILPWSHADERLERARNYWVVTVRPDGRPHAVPLWGAWVDGAFFWEGGGDTRWGRNLKENRAVAVHLESGDDVVILEGFAEEVGAPDQELAVRIAESYGSRYEYKPKPDSWSEGGLYRMRPRLALAWTHFPQDVTRFRFDEE